MVGEGSLAQLFVGSAISFFFFALHTKLEPYRHGEDNLFRTSTEIFLFFFILIALVLKSLDRAGVNASEALTRSYYDAFLCILFSVTVPMAFSVAVYRKYRVIEEFIQQPVDPSMADDVQAKCHALNLLKLGLASNSHRDLLAAYFSKLDRQFNKMTHVFISYRVASDRDLARRLYEELSMRVLMETGQAVRVYLDQVGLEDGQRWDSGFMEGLANSWIFVPIVSVGSVGPMATMSELEDWTDNVLLEWAAALELHSRGLVKALLPIILGDEDFFAEAAAAFGGISSLPDHVSAATSVSLSNHLESITGDGSVDSAVELVRSASGQTQEGATPGLTVQGVVSSVLKFQGVKLNRSMANQGHAHGHAATTLDDLTVCVNRIRDTVSASFKLGQGGATPVPDRSTMSSRLSSRLRRGGGDGAGNDVEAPELSLGEAPELSFGEPGSALHLATEG
jgi:hypothetical protein